MSTDRCTCPSFIDGGVLRRKSCPHHVTPTPPATPEPVRDMEAEELACAWADYRKDYGVKAGDHSAHKAFRAGWKAAREGDQSGALR